MLNSSLLFELAVIKNQAEFILRQVPNNVPEYAVANRLLQFLRYFKSIDDAPVAIPSTVPGSSTTLIPGTSLIREFLGGSSFRE